MSYQLYLDDHRDPFESEIGWLTDEDERAAVNAEWTIVRDYATFVEMIEDQGLPSRISFDHDLGLAETGYDAAKWLVENALDRGWDLTQVTVTVHSANPVGRKNIHELITNFQNFQRSEQWAQRASAWEAFWEGFASIWNIFPNRDRD